MISVTVNVTGDKEFMAKLERLGSALENFKEALEIIGAALVEYYSNDVFRSQGGVFGVPWAKLAPSTVAEKSKHYRAYSAIPLIATGTMRDSFSAEASSKHLEITNTAPYFIYHQSSAPRRLIPRRQMMGIDRHSKNLIEAIIKADIDKKVGSL